MVDQIKPPKDNKYFSTVMKPLQIRARVKKMHTKQNPCRNNLVNY